MIKMLLMVRYVNYVLLGVAFGVQSYILLDQGSEFDIISCVFWGWLTLPFLAMFLANRYLGKTWTARLALFAATFIISAGGTFLIYDAFHAHLDPQSGLVFLFIPLYALIITVITSALAVCLNHFTAPDPA